MSNSSVKVALAFCVVLTFPPALFAQHAGSAATGNVPITAIDARGVGKCFRGSPATTVAHNRHRPEIVHSNSVCWAPRNTTDGPEV